jgi:hypothetical protein
MSSESTAEPAILEQVQNSLIRIERLLAIGFGEQIQALREARGVGDSASVELLRRTPGWTPAGDLRRSVAKSTDQSEVTVRRRIDGLLELGALERRGKTTSVEYRSTGLLG